MSRRKVKKAKARRARESKPVDVSGLKALSTNEEWAQRCDARSLVARLSEWPWKPAAAAYGPGIGQHLGGRRVYIHAYNATFSDCRALRESGLHAPYMVAVHLWNTLKQWRDVERLRGEMKEAGTTDESRERISCDLVCQATLAAYSCMATLETFCNETEGTGEDTRQKTDEGSSKGGNRRSVLERIKDLLTREGAELPAYYHEIARLGNARNLLTHRQSTEHGGSENVDETLGKALDAILRVKENPGIMVIRVMEAAVGKQATRWAREVSEQVMNQIRREPEGEGQQAGKPSDPP